MLSILPVVLKNKISLFYAKQEDVGPATPTTLCALIDSTKQMRARPSHRTRSCVCYIL